MKKKYGLYLILLALILVETGYKCFEKPDPIEYYTPIYLSRTELNQSIKLTAPRNLSSPGKIYVLGNYVYINERYEGIHIIDNSNPSKPVNLGFIEIPGNLDIVAKDFMLYVDNAVDLVTIDISKPQNIRVVNRQEDVLPPIQAPDGRNAYFYGYNASQGYIINWDKSIKN